MGMRALEAGILRELREVEGDQGILQRHIMEWSTGEIKAGEGEKLVRLPDLGVNVAYKPRVK